MRRPHLSTGAWIFAGIVTAAVIAPVGVYAAATSTTAIGNTTNSNTATVTSQHQLLTTPIAPKQVVHVFEAVSGGACTVLYTPPAGKAVLITAVTWDVGSGTQGTEEWAELTNSTCSSPYEIADTTQGFDTQHFEYPTGVPVPTITAYDGTSATAIVEVTGYLIPASQLPAASHTAQVPRRLRADPKLRPVAH
jgi:hypothetical protein